MSKKKVVSKRGISMLLFSTIEDDYSRDKLEELYYKYHKYVYKIVYNILNDSYLAQDVVQSVFIKLIENIDKIDRIECNKTKAFIVIITRNLSINLYRKRNSHKNMVLENIEDVICDTSQPIDERIISEEILDRISHNR
ncbi:MAG: sigma-70 family RNA polymerase sigma factor [Clostridiales bacterium]|nr:sigma-70 family RNA polymerase sigma factor [Clostridiales bacterium]